MAKKDKAPEQYFKGDYGSRYVRKREALARRDGGDRSVMQDIRQDPSESIAAWVWNFDSMYTGRIQSLVNRGKFAEAAALYEEAKSTIDENEGNLFALAELRGAGEVSDEVATRAVTILNNPFTKATAKFNGEDVPLDTLLQDGGSLAVDAARDEFMSLGLSNEVTDAFFGDDNTLRSTVRGLVQPILSGQRADHGQRLELAEDVVSNWDELYGLFGDGVPHLIARHQATHSGAGGASDSLRSLLTVARGLNSTKNLSGKDLAREVLGAYDGLVSKVFARETSDKDAQGRPRETGVSATKRMLFDSVLASSVKTLTDMGIAPDLRSAKFTKAVAEVMDAQAYASDCGIDLVGLGHDSGNPVMPAFGQYVANAVAEVPQTGANPINAFRAFRHLLDNQITGGQDFANEIYRLTGNAEDYYQNMNKANGGFSSSPGADAIARGIKSYLIQQVAPGMIAGMSPDDALRAARSGSLHSGTDFLVGLSDNISQHLYGEDKNNAANLIAASVSDALERGQRFSVEEIVRDLLVSNNAFDNPDGQEGTGALLDWYHGNVAQASEYAQKNTQLRAHLLHDERLPDYVVASELSKTAQEAGRMRRLGRDGTEVYDARLKAGTVYYPQIDPRTGMQVLDQANNPVIVRQVVPDRGQFGYNPNGDNSQFNAHQQQFREQYQFGQQYAKAAASAMGRKSVDEDA